MTLRMTHENRFYKNIVEVRNSILRTSTKQAMLSSVILSIFMKIHKNEDSLNLYIIVFMKVGFHEPGIMT